VFTDEGEWIAAFNAAEFEVRNLLESGILAVAQGMSEPVWVKHVAVKIATAAINGGNQAVDTPTDDIASLPGVEVQTVSEATWFAPLYRLAAQA
jgi:hypothetical protein